MVSNIIMDDDFLAHCNLVPLPSLSSPEVPRVSSSSSQAMPPQSLSASPGQKESDAGEVDELPVSYKHKNAKTHARNAYHVCSSFSLCFVFVLM
jgi:hypothetical protein